MGNRRMTAAKGLPWVAAKATCLAATWLGEGCGPMVLYDAPPCRGCWLGQGSPGPRVHPGIFLTVLAWGMELEWCICSSRPVSNRVAPGYSSCCTLPVKVPVCDPCTHLAAPLDPHGAAFPVDPLSGHLQTFAACQTRDRVTPDIEILSILLQS